ncbi:MAG: indole-3-glycerol phosphate synthase TrpC [Deltaproteobacteria bacterium]|nr:indole-3-glycerol phosphate synthase TrpC [Candidatus Anaeroferrophillus wilburensis]MBN2888549.1 indole-3-glycerol phosphate synthase TrpC [Deltaproteobacteria bacterium]
MNVVNILEKIVICKRDEVARLKKTGVMTAPAGADADRRSLLAALSQKPQPRIIAEVKKASPSAGLLSDDFDPLALAMTYEQGGAAAISVVTDEAFFQGRLDWLAMVKKVVSLPLLRKDFIIDPLQLEQSRAAGADAVLLIAAILSLADLQLLLDKAAALGLECLVEVHNESELEKVLATPAAMIGINNRNLKDFSIDLGTTLRLRTLIPADRLVVSESGIDSHGQLQRLGAAGVQGVLIGSSLVKAAGRLHKLRQLQGMA